MVLKVLKFVSSWRRCADDVIFARFFGLFPGLQLISFQFPLSRDKLDALGLCIVGL